MRNLSKSKILAFRQCPKKLWLSVHQPDLAVYSDDTQARFKTGDIVGDIARTLYDPGQVGTLINPFKDGFKFALNQTQTLLDSNNPIFEASFSASGGFVMTDILLPGTDQHWSMVEVKSSTSVKDTHIEDIAVQAYVTQAAGVKLQQVSLACIDNQFVYQGDANYSGLLKETDLSEPTFARQDEVSEWFAEAHSIANTTKEPDIDIGEHCKTPYDCAFLDYCSKGKPQAQFPVNWLPRVQTKNLKGFIQDHAVIEMADVPNHLLNAKQLRVKEYTLSDSVFFDADAAKRALGDNELPAYFLDFETTNLAVPIWKGVRPYQQVVFQFSCHKLTEDGELIHTEFLDTSGKDPSPQCVQQLLADCGTVGPIYVYNAGFEKGRIKELAERFPESSKALLALNERIVDLWPIAKAHFYHPGQQGSWSIKKVLPAIAPDLDYSALEGVQDGGMAMDAFIEAIHPDTSNERKQAIQSELLKYCELDTYAMVRLWQFFDGQLV